MNNNINFSSIDSINQQLQQIIKNQYIANGAEKIFHDRIDQAGFRCYSQFEEDGIILYILSVIGMKTKKVVEMCCGNGEECMATNLILNHGYTGYLFDGNQDNINNAKAFFRIKQDTLLNAPRVEHAWITKENVNSLLLNSGATGEVDLLSLDMDGIDYYVWEAISEINPRLCVFETHDIIPGDLSLTIPYQPDFYCWDKPDSESDFRSVSLKAMKELSESKGYRMIGAHRHGFNVFFLRNDIAKDYFKEVSIADIHHNPWTEFGQQNRWPKVKDMPWVNV